MKVSAILGLVFAAAIALYMVVLLVHYTSENDFRSGFYTALVGLLAAVLLPLLFMTQASSAKGDAKAGSKAK